MLYSVKAALKETPALGIAAEIGILMIAGVILGFIIAMVVGVVLKIFPGLDKAGKGKAH